MEKMWPPLSVNSLLTPCAFRRRAISRPPWTRLPCSMSVLIAAHHRAPRAPRVHTFPTTHPPSGCVVRTRRLRCARSGVEPKRHLNPRREESPMDDARFEQPPAHPREDPATRRFAAIAAEQDALELGVAAPDEGAVVAAQQRARGLRQQDVVAGDPRRL